MGWGGVREGLQFLFFVFAFLVFPISRGLIATTAAILALTAVRYLGIEVDDALSISEQVEL